MAAIALDDLTVNNKEVLRKINEVVLPTRYPDEFYKNSLESSDFVKLAFYSEVPVGAIKAKLIVPQHHSVPTSVYIESIAVLEPYRHLGIGQKLVEYIIEQAKKAFIHEVTAHVWVEQPEVLKWYVEKLGFEEDGKIDNYYKEQKLDNPTAVLVKRKF